MKTFATCANTSKLIHKYTICVSFVHICVLPKKSPIICVYNHLALVHWGELLHGRATFFPIANNVWTQQTRKCIECTNIYKYVQIYIQKTQQIQKCIECTQIYTENTQIYNVQCCLWIALMEKQLGRI